MYTIYRRVCARSSTRSLTTPHILLSMVPGECRRKERAPGGCLGMAERDKERERERMNISMNHNEMNGSVSMRSISIVCLCCCCCCCCCFRSFHFVSFVSYTHNFIFILREAMRKKTDCSQSISIAFRCMHVENRT